MSGPQPHSGLDETQPYVAPQGNFDQPKQKSWFGTCAIGCLIIGIVSIAMCGVGSFIAYKQAPAMIVSGSREVLDAVLEESDLPLDEREGVMTEFDRVGDAFLAGDLTWQEMAEMGEELAQSPVMTFIIIFGIEKRYLDNSGLAEEEKQEAKQTMMRLSRGVMEDQISEEEMQQIANYVLDNPGTDQAQLKERLTDEELREFFAAAKSLCDEKEISEEEFDLKLSEKIREIVDGKLGAR